MSKKVVPNYQKPLTIKEYASKNPKFTYSDLEKLQEYDRDCYYLHLKLEKEKAFKNKIIFGSSKDKFFVNINEQFEYKKKEYIKIHSISDEMFHFTVIRVGKYKKENMFDISHYHGAVFFSNPGNYLKEIEEFTESDKNEFNNVLNTFENLT